MENKKDFIRYVMASNSMSGAFQHIKIYPENFSPKQKEEFKLKVHMELYKMEKNYINNEVSARAHLSNINFISKNFQFSFGVAQKLLNLYLKYLWCIGEVTTPPHCPVDSQILKQVKMLIPWSKMNKENYEEAINKVEEKSKNGGFKNMAEWELSVWKSSLISVNERG